jgi:plasmid rolling circle replication initiator protein Rep
MAEADALNSTHTAPACNDGLRDYSPKDAKWDAHRATAQQVEDIYLLSNEFERYAARMGRCSGLLSFGKVIDPDTGQIALRLRQAQFCRVRHCPVCQWRRALMWLARFYNALPDIQAAYPTARWLFLTLTVKNCPIEELRATLTAMNTAWNRLRLRKEFAPVLGWVRTTEVTRGKDGSAHPHFHTLMMVPSSMLAGKHYVKQGRWTELWGECGKLDYTPMVDIRAVKALPGMEADPLAGIRAAAAETLKYAVKPSDMVADPEWFLEMTRQLHKMRFVATGGVLKDVLRVEDESDEEMIHGDDEAKKSADDGARLAFSWRPSDKRYRRCPKADKPATE